MEILKRSIGEPITLTTMLTGNIWKTRIDASEVENAILNLAINARDAMPNGGALIIETRNATANTFLRRRRWRVCPPVRDRYGGGHDTEA
jgi:signal transduction histidine kinase